MKTVFLRKLTYANLKRNLQEQIRYTLRNKNQEDLCEDLANTLTETLSDELRDKVGPEDILSECQLEELQDALNESARRILKSNRMQFNHMKRMEARVKRAIEKTLVAPKAVRLSEVRTALGSFSLISSHTGGTSSWSSNLFSLMVRSCSLINSARKLAT